MLLRQSAQIGSFERGESAFSQCSIEQYNCEAISLFPIVSIAKSTFAR